MVWEREEEGGGGLHRSGQVDESEKNRNWIVECKSSFLERYRQTQREKEGREWHSNVNREKEEGRLDEKAAHWWIPQKPLQYVWGQFHRLRQPQTSDRTERRGDQQRRFCWKERALLLSADFTVCPGSPEKGDHPEALFTIPCFPLTQQHNSLGVYRRLSVNNLRTKLQRCTKAQLHHYIHIQSWSERETKIISLGKQPSATLHFYSGILNRKL